MTRLDDQTDQTGPDGQIEMDELVKALQAAEVMVGKGRVVVDKTPEEKEAAYWDKQLDPDQIKQKNWARKHKRSKHLWRTTRGGGGNPNIQADRLRNLLGGG